MKTATLFAVIFLISLASWAQDKENKPLKLDPTRKVQVAEASCGECQFGLSGKGCDLAVRINGKAYFVDGTKIDDHGDAHAQDGFCEAIRKAEVQGELVDNRFRVTWFKLLANTTAKETKDEKKNK
jgi:hypothetical protein